MLRSTCGGTNRLPFRGSFILYTVLVRRRAYCLIKCKCAFTNKFRQHTKGLLPEEKYRVPTSPIVKITQHRFISTEIFLKKIENGIAQYIVKFDQLLSIFTSQVAVAPNFHKKVVKV